MPDTGLRPITQDIALELGEHGQVFAPVANEDYSLVYAAMRHIQMGLANSTGLFYVSIYLHGNRIKEPPI
jgi:hypothetical protein